MITSLKNLNAGTWERALYSGLQRTNAAKVCCEDYDLLARMNGPQIVQRAKQLLGLAFFLDRDER